MPVDMAGRGVVGNATHPIVDLELGRREDFWWSRATFPMHVVIR